MRHVDVDTVDRRNAQVARAQDGQQEDLGAALFRQQGALPEGDETFARTVVREQDLLIHFERLLPWPRSLAATSQSDLIASTSAPNRRGRRPRRGLGDEIP